LEGLAAAPLLHSSVLGFEPCPGTEHTHNLPATELERQQFLPRELLKPLRPGFYPEVLNGMNSDEKISPNPNILKIS
jgi:hypothetical protein